MGRFTKLSSDAFQKMQFNAGVILKDFNPEEPGTTDEMVANIIFATTGDINFKAEPTYSDFGEDVNNCPNNMAEFKKLTQWAVSLEGTAVTIDKEGITLAIGPADADETNTNKIIPRNTLKLTDFNDIWWVGDYGDDNSDETGGFIAVKIKNALSTGGLSLATGKESKGKMAFTLSGHYRLTNPDEVPFDIYCYEGG